MNYDTSFLDVDQGFDSGIKTVWDYSRLRFAQFVKSPAARLEMGAVLLSLLALFGLSYVSWFQNWTQPQSIQGYAVWVVPLTLGWLWVSRYRVILPELDSLNERFTERSVLRFLLEEAPEPVKRLRWPLVFGVIWTPIALRLGDPLFTCIAFWLLLLGIVGYRFGTQQLRLLFFPFCFLLTMIPLPGFVLDFAGKRLDTLAFKTSVHLLQIAGFNAELPGVEANPLVLFGDPAHPAYRVFVGQVGTGFAEAGLFLAVTLCYLSLVNTMFRRKLAALISAVVWIGTLVVLRVFLLASIGRLVDEDYFAALISLTRYLLPVVGFAGQMLIMRGLKCRPFHEWVTV